MVWKSRFGEMKIHIFLTIKKPMIKIIVVIYAGNIKEHSKLEKDEIIIINLIFHMQYEKQTFYSATYKSEGPGCPSGYEAGPTNQTTLVRFPSPLNFS